MQCVVHVLCMMRVKVHRATSPAERSAVCAQLGRSWKATTRREARSSMIVAGCSCLRKKRANPRSTENGAPAPTRIDPAALIPIWPPSFYQIRLLHLFYFISIFISILRLLCAGSSSSATCHPPPPNSHNLAHHASHEWSGNASLHAEGERHSGCVLRCAEQAGCEKRDFEAAIEGPRRCGCFRRF